jgi:ATP/maltotriose-dependent transcriptional regulator MalT
LSSLGRRWGMPVESVAGTVARPRLVALLDEGAQRRLLTVVADAGFGKSTLLSSWAAGRRCAWHTVRAEDASLAAMVSGLVEALRRQVPALEAIPAELQSPRGPDADAEQQTRALAYAALLADALEQNLSNDLVLVLDDLHEIDPLAPATRLIEGLVRTAPSNLHLVVASRTQMPFGIDRLRGRGQVLEIDATALAFTVPETLAVLQKVLGEGSDDLAESLQTAVQGWPAAVRLAVEAAWPYYPGSDPSCARPSDWRTAWRPSSNCVPGDYSCPRVRRMATSSTRWCGTSPRTGWPWM